MTEIANGLPTHDATADASKVDRHPLAAVRKHCLDCSGGSSKCVRYCPCDGLHSGRCFLWPFRFGKRPATAARAHGPEFLDPARMPSGDVNLEALDTKGVTDGS